MIDNYMKTGNPYDDGKWMDEEPEFDPWADEEDEEPEDDMHGEFDLF
jgi:hypothetical protein